MCVCHRIVRTREVQLITIFLSFSISASGDGAEEEGAFSRRLRRRPPLMCPRLRLQEEHQKRRTTKRAGLITPTTSSENVCRRRRLRTRRRKEKKPPSSLLAVCVYTHKGSLCLCFPPSRCCSWRPRRTRGEGGRKTLVKDSCAWSPPKVISWRLLLLLLLPRGLRETRRRGRPPPRPQDPPHSLQSCLPSPHKSPACACVYTQ